MLFGFVSVVSLAIFFQQNGDGDQEKTFISYWPFSIILIAILNSYLLIKGARIALTYILFPYSSSLVKHSYHQQMNMKMCNELKSTLIKVLDSCNSLIVSEQHSMADSYMEVKERTHSIKKLIDYLKLFK